MKLSLRWKMLLLVFGLIMVPTVLLGINQYYSAKSLLSDNLRASAREILRGSADTTEMFLSSVQEATEMISRDWNVRSMVRDPHAYDGMYNVFEAYAETHKDIQNVYFGTKDKEMYPYPKVDLPPGFDPTARGWYIEAVAKKSMVWTEPYIDTGSAKLIVSVAMPVLDSRDSQPLGVVGIDVSLDSLTDLLSVKTVGEKGYLVLLDARGNVLAHPDRTQIGATLSLADVVKATTVSRAGDLDYKEGNEEKFASFTTLPSTGWKLLALISYAEINAHVEAQFKRTLLIGLVLLVVAFGLGIVFTNRLLIRPVSNLVQVAEEIGKGNFRVAIDLNSNDELGWLAQSLVALQRNLGTLIGAVKDASNQMAGLSQAVFGSSQDISASTEEMAATTNQFASSVQQTSDQVQSIDSDGGEIRKVAQVGETMIRQAVEQMKNIEISFESLHGSVEKLGVQSSEIGKITDIIRGISDQTNLLALNAAIEAARAGDQGRGFAVVAEEVRKLAEQSALATEQISELLRDIDVQVSRVMKETDGSIKEVKSGSSSVQTAGTTFSQIGQAVNNISLRIQEIAVSGLELSRGSEEMAAATEEQAATLEQITSSAHTLAEQAGVLMELTEGFQIEE